MKIRTQLSLRIAGVTAVVFLLCLTLIYVVSEHTRRNTFFHDLRSEAVTKAHLYLKGETDAHTMQAIYLNNKKFINEVEVAVYTPDFRMLYHDAIENDIVKETPQMIRDILHNGEVELRIGKYEGIGMVYTFEGSPYIITAAAYDGYGHDSLAELRKTLLLLFIVGLSLLFIAGYLLARASLRPIRHIVSEAEHITASQISRRLPVKNAGDELGELSIAFNALLDRLEASFESQKMFVSNVSHELRTPLAALIAEMDLALQKERTPERYRTALQNALADARRMNALIDGLLNLAKADYSKEQISMQEIRLDELLLDVREALLRAHPDYHIDLVFGQEEDDDDRSITVQGNAYLLAIAFSNLIDNNCKYAPNRTSTVQISSWEGTSIVRCSDTGSGISDEEMQHLFELFHRGPMQEEVDGHGIGMPLTRKIIRLHGGELTVRSSQGEGTTFVVELPHI